MTYVTEQSSAELRTHMHRLKAMDGWHDPLADRLFREIEALDAEIKRARTSQAVPTKEQIKGVFLQHGFAVKDGLDDLKPYVYEAAYALLKLAAPTPKGPQS